MSYMFQKNKTWKETLKDLINLEGGRYAIIFCKEKMYKTKEKHNF